LLSIVDEALFESWGSLFTLPLPVLKLFGFHHRWRNSLDPMALGGRPRLSTTPDLKNKKEFMAIKQLTKRPIHCLPYRRKRFEGFCMVDKKASVSA
jgi:hypothetical protein